MMYRGFGGRGIVNGQWMFLMMGFKLLILAALIVVLIILFKKYTNTSNNALKILDELFAKGEINEEEYIKRKTVLTKKD